MQDLFPLESDLIPSPRKGWISPASTKRLEILGQLFGSIGELAPFSESQSQLQLLLSVSGAIASKVPAVIAYHAKPTIPPRVSYEVFVKKASKKTQETHVFSNILSRQADFQSLSGYIAAYFDRMAASKAGIRVPRKLGERLIYTPHAWDSSLVPVQETLLSLFGSLPPYTRIVDIQDIAKQIHESGEQLQLNIHEDDEFLTFQKAWNHSTPLPTQPLTVEHESYGKSFISAGVSRSSISFENIYYFASLDESDYERVSGKIPIPRLREISKHINAIRISDPSKEGDSDGSSINLIEKIAEKSRKIIRIVSAYQILRRQVPIVVMLTIVRTASLAINEDIIDKFTRAIGAYIPPDRNVNERKQMFFRVMQQVDRLYTQHYDELSKYSSILKEKIEGIAITGGTKELSPLAMEAEIPRYQPECYIFRTQRPWLGVIENGIPPQVKWETLIRPIRPLTSLSISSSDGLSSIALKQVPSFIGIERRGGKNFELGNCWIPSSRFYEKECWNFAYLRSQNAFAYHLPVAVNYIGGEPQIVYDDIEVIYRWKIKNSDKYLVIIQNEEIFVQDKIWTSLWASNDPVKKISVYSSISMNMNIPMTTYFVASVTAKLADSVSKAIPEENQTIRNALNGNRLYALLSAYIATISSRPTLGDYAYYAGRLIKSLETSSIFAKRLAMGVYPPDQLFSLSNKDLFPEIFVTLSRVSNPTAIDELMRKAFIETQNDILYSGLRREDPTARVKTRPSEMEAIPAFKKDERIEEVATWLKWRGVDLANEAWNLKSKKKEEKTVATEANKGLEEWKEICRTVVANGTPLERTMVLYNPLSNTFICVAIETILKNGVIPGTKISIDQETMSRARLIANRELTMAIYVDEVRKHATPEISKKEEELYRMLEHMSELKDIIKSKTQISQKGCSMCSEVLNSKIVSNETFEFCKRQAKTCKLSVPSKTKSKFDRFTEAVNNLIRIDKRFANFSDCSRCGESVSSCGIRVPFIEPYDANQNPVSGKAVMKSYCSVKCIEKDVEYPETN